jgi:hypothetical protein
MLDRDTELAYVILHGINDEDVVTCDVELSRQVQGYREAAISEEDVQRVARGLIPLFLIGTALKTAHLRVLWLR